MTPTQEIDHLRDVLGLIAVAAFKADLAAMSAADPLRDAYAAGLADAMEYAAAAAHVAPQAAARLRTLIFAPTVH